MNKHTIKEGVSQGVYVLLDTRTPDGKGHIVKDHEGDSIKVLITRSLSFTLKMDLGDGLMAARLMDSLNRTLSAKRLMGETPQGVLRICVDAKENHYVQGKLTEFAPNEGKCILFSLDGQMSDKGVCEVGPEAIKALDEGRITKEDVLKELARELGDKEPKGDITTDLDEKIRETMQNGGHSEIMGVKIPETFGPESLPESLEALRQVLRKCPKNMVREIYGATKSIYIMAVTAKDEQAMQRGKATLEVIKEILDEKADEKDEG